MKRTLSLLLCLCALLCACQSQPETPTEAPTAAPTQAPTQAPTEAPTEATVPTTEATLPPETTEAATVPTTEPPVLYTHPLTGLPLEEPMTTRPVAVVINNLSAAQPLMGIGFADVVFEHIAEGGGTVTRLLAIFTDLEGEYSIGSIRSARTYLIDLARTFHAPLVHCGYSSYAEANLLQTKYPSFNEFFYGEYFYRDQNRLNDGYPREHTLVIDAKGLHLGLREKNFNMTVDPDIYYGMDFAEHVDLDGETANSIRIRFFSDFGKITTMNYDATQGMYYGTQQWNSIEKSMIDGNTGTAVPFKNVLILNVATWFAEDRYHVFTEMTGEGTGYYACNGEYVPIKWYRGDVSEPFTYTFVDGSPLYLEPGRTYIAMQYTGGPEVIFE